MVKGSTIDAAEALAFVKVVAPRLEQLRRGLAAAKSELKNGDPETARLTAIIESQLAIKEFVSGIANLAPLVEPIDLLIEAVRDEALERQSEPPPPPPLAPSTPEKPRSPAPGAFNAQAHEPPADGWLRIGTAIAIERLTNAGMQAANAESYLAQSYAAVGLKQWDGSPISDELIREWRSKFVGSGSNTWRRKTTLKRRVGSKAAGGGGLVEVKGRVDEMAAVFKRIAQLANAGR